MNSVFRTFLLWLLIAALPVQGMAAATQATCGPAHHNVMQSEIQSASSVHVHPHGLDPAHHHGTPALNDSTSGTDLTTGKQWTSSNQLASSYCSACAACCVGAVAPPSAIVNLPELKKSESVTVSPITLLVGYLPFNLDRPPRHSLV
jgi:hypothetical protein